VVCYGGKFCDIDPDISQLWKEVIGFLYSCNTLITTYQIQVIPSSDS